MRSSHSGADFSRSVQVRREFHPDEDILSTTRRGFPAKDGHFPLADLLLNGGDICMMQGLPNDMPYKGDWRDGNLQHERI